MQQTERRPRFDWFGMIEAGIGITAIAFLIGVMLYGSIYSTILDGNYWCTQIGVEAELKSLHPKIESVEIVDRHIWNETRVDTRAKDGTMQTFCLDTDILFRYDFNNCSK